MRASSSAQAAETGLSETETLSVIPDICHLNAAKNGYIFPAVPSAVHQKRAAKQSLLCPFSQNELPEHRTFTSKAETLPNFSGSIFLFFFIILSVFLIKQTCIQACENFIHFSVKKYPFISIFLLFIIILINIY
jgi:hypothetical protein